MEGIATKQRIDNDCSFCGEIVTTDRNEEGQIG